MNATTTEGVAGRAPVKAYKGIALEGRIAKWYAASTRNRLEEFKALARSAVEGLPPGGKVLEVAPGPGYAAIEVAKLGDFRVTGLDISRTMVEIAGDKAKEAGVEVDFRLGNAASMPFESETFDRLFCCAAFKNFTQPVRALEEMYRVLRAGGRALIVDLRKDASPETINQYVERMGLNWWNKVTSRFTFRSLLKRAYTRSEFEQFVSQTSFQTAEVRENLIGLEIRLEKRASDGT